MELVLRCRQFRFNKTHSLNICQETNHFFRFSAQKGLHLYYKSRINRFWSCMHLVMALPPPPLAFRHPNLISLPTSNIPLAVHLSSTCKPRTYHKNMQPQRISRKFWQISWKQIHSAIFFSKVPCKILLRYKMHFCIIFCGNCNSAFKLISISKASTQIQNPEENIIALWFQGFLIFYLKPFFFEWSIYSKE